MSALEFIAWIASVAPAALRTALEQLKEWVPDAAEAIDKVLADMSSGLSPAAIAAAVLALPDEALKAITLRFNPRNHPSDLA